MTEEKPLGWEMRSSRGANRIAAFGALLVMGAFAVALLQLFRLDREVSERKKELQQMIAQLHRVQVEKDGLLQENSRLKKQRNQLKRVNQDLEDAVRLQQSRDYQKAWEKLYVILQKDAENEVAYSYAAHSCYQLGRYPEAISYAENSMRIDPSYLDPYVPLICALNRLGKRIEALNYLRTILNQSPENYLALVSRKRYFDELWAIKESRASIIIHQDKLKGIQERLKALGYYTCRSCKIDAMFGGGTMTALQQFYSTEGITNKLSVDKLSEALVATSNTAGPVSASKR